MGPLGITLPGAGTPRVNAMSHSRPKNLAADPCFSADGQSVSALTHATRWAEDLASGRATAVMHPRDGGLCVVVRLSGTMMAREVA